MGRKRGKPQSTKTAVGSVPVPDLHHPRAKLGAGKRCLSEDDRDLSGQSRKLAAIGNEDTYLGRPDGLEIPDPKHPWLGVYGGMHAEITVCQVPDVTWFKSAGCAVRHAPALPRGRSRALPVQVATGTMMRRAS
jgi:hypothetical protein